MQFLALLGKHLKDDEVIELLEGFDMDVVYDFDRFHEGQPDRYWASAKDAGIQLRFDTSQTLDCIFIYMLPSDGFIACSENEMDIPVFATAAATESFGKSQHSEIAKGSAEFLGINRNWVRLAFSSHSVHYEFRGSSLALITVTRTAR